MQTKEIMDMTEKFYLPVFVRNKIALDHGVGTKLYDADGKEYTDFFAGIAVNALGYAHPAVVKAICEQAGKLIHCSNLYYTEIQAKCVAKISEISTFDRVFLCNSGAEANEGAIKLALKYGTGKNPKKFKFITALESFHGRTMETLTATGQEHYHEGLGPLPVGFSYVPYGDIDALTKAMDNEVCGVLLEPIQGEGGVHVPPEGYLAKAKELCEKHDALLIMDEVQTGVCRSGKWFAWMLSGVKPDIMTMAKAIGGGIPMGAFAVDEKLAHVFKPGDHGTTFGGNVLACAASYATLCTLDENHMAETAAKQGEYFKGKMKELQAKFPDKITDVRGSGLILGMELAKPGAFVVDKCLAKGFIINCTVGNVLRFVPPLIISKAEIDALVAALAEIFQEF